MKKKCIALVLSGMMVFSLTACGGSGSAAESSASAQAETSAAVDDGEEEAEVEEETEVEEEAEVEEDVEAEEADVTEDEAGEEEVSDDLQAFLQQLSLLAPTEDIIGTGWAFSGGMIDGTEMEQEDADAALELYNGSLEIVFDDEENIRMVQGGGTLEGVYGLAEDGYVMEIVFDNNGSELKYAGVFADVDGTVALMLFSDATGQNAIYFTQITEE